MQNLYFVLYGNFDYKVYEDSLRTIKDTKSINGKPPTRHQIQFGERCGLGWTLGEEILFDEDEKEKDFGYNHDSLREDFDFASNSIERNMDRNL